MTHLIKKIKSVFLNFAYGYPFFKKCFCLNFLVELVFFCAWFRELFNYINPYIQADVMNGYGAVSPICIYCDMIRYLTQNKSPSVKKGFMSIIEGFPHVGVERFELPTPCSQSMGQLSVLPSIKWLFFVVTSTETPSTYGIYCDMIRLKRINLLFLPSNLSSLFSFAFSRVF